MVGLLGLLGSGRVFLGLSKGMLYESGRWGDSQSIVNLLAQMPFSPL
jgi:hypothetical protein